jgi:hypothetical protein
MGWPEVADTALKIGLGALLGGAFSVVLARLNQRHDLRKLALERRWNLLQEAQSEITLFGSLVSQFWAGVRNAVYLRASGKPLTVQQTEELEKLERLVFEGFAGLGVPRSKLLLLGEKGANQALDRMRHSCDAFFRIASLENVQCTGEGLDKAKESISEARDALYDAMAQAYARVGT